MSAIVLLAAAVAVFLGAYLIYALFNAEKF